MPVSFSNSIIATQVQNQKQRQQEYQQKVTEVQSNINALCKLFIYLFN